MKNKSVIGILCLPSLFLCYANYVSAFSFNLNCRKEAPPQLPSLLSSSSLLPSLGKHNNNIEKKVVGYRRRRPSNTAIYLKNDADDDNEDEESNDAVYYDDFNFTIGSSSSSARSSSSGSVGLLQERIREVQQTQVRKDSQLFRNWKAGDWSVRGFSLDQHDALSMAKSPEAQQQQPIHVSKVAPDANHDDRVWVGRTDGSLAWVRIGTDHITNFRSKLVAKTASSSTTTTTSSDDDQTGGNENTADLTMTVSSQLVPDQDIAFVSSEQQTSSSTDTAADDNNPPYSDPFEILAYAPESAVTKGSISAILSVPEEDCVLTARRGSGRIQQWQIVEDDSSSSSAAAELVPVRTHYQENVHDSDIVALKTVVDDDNRQTLFSAGRDGSMALWDVHTGGLLYRGRVLAEDEEGKNEIVLCADVDEANHNVYVGTESGFVLGYNLRELLLSSDAAPKPNGRFLAHETGVTAIGCGGEGTLGRGGSAKSTLLVTGGARDGVVKQWEMLSISSSSSSTRLEPWPKLKTQRLPKKDHLFIGHETDQSINNVAFASERGQKIISSSTDGTVRVWDPTRGKRELYRMDGFSADLSSLCMQGDALITDGMNQYVCVHDFDTAAFDPNDMIHKDDGEENDDDGDDWFDF